MTDVASLALQIDTSQLKQGSSELDNFTRKGEQAEASTKKLATATQILESATKLAVGAFAGFKLAGFIQESTMLAARFETMGVVMKIAGNNAGYTRAQMEEYSKALQKSGISMLQSRDALTQLATANIDLAKAANLGRAAQDLAVVANINSSDALGRMIHGIKAGEIEVLRTMGMNVSWEASYKKLAAEIGTTSDKLSEHQKMTARTNAVLAEAAKYNGIYEESMTTAGKAMNSLKRYWEDLKVKMGEAFLPALTDAVFGLTDALKAANKELDKAGSSGLTERIGEGLGMAFRTVYETVVVLGANIAYVFTMIGNEIGGIAAQAAAVMRGDFAGAREIGKQMTADAEAARAAVDKFSESVLNKARSEKAASAVSEEERIKRGVATRQQAEEDAKAMEAASASAKARKLAAAEAERAYDAIIKKSGDYITSLQKEGAEEGQTYEEKKKYEAAAIASSMLLAGVKGKQVVAFLQSAEAIAHENQLTKETIANQKIEVELNAKKFANYTANLTTLDQQVVAQKRHNEEIGLTREQLIELEYVRDSEAISIKERQLAIAEATSDDTSYIKTLEWEIEALKELRGLKKEGGTRTVATESIKKMEEEAKKSADEINRSLTDALMRGFESGKGFAQNLVDTVKNMFNTMVLRPIISAIVSPVGNMVSGAMGSMGIPGYANAASSGGGALNLASNASTLYSVGGEVIGNTVSALGTGATSIGGILGATGAEIGAAATYGTAVGSTSTAMIAAQEAGMLTAAGGAGTGITAALAAVPVWGWIAAAALMIFAMGDEPTPPSGLLATLKPDDRNLPTRRFDRNSGVFSDGAYSVSPFGQIGATQAFAYSGESAQKYLDMIAQLDRTLATYLSPDQVGIVANNLQQRTYGGGGEGWLESALPSMIRDRFTETFNQVNPLLNSFLTEFQGTAEEILVFGGALLEIDKGLSDVTATTRLFGEAVSLDAIQGAALEGENVVQAFQRIQSEFALTNEIANMMGQSSSTAFGAVGLASEGARRALIEAAGGLDALAAKTSNFFKLYYSDSERQMASARYSLAIVNDGFAQLGMTVPGTMEQFRALAEAQDLSTSEGRRVYMAMMDMAGAFATVAGAGGAAAVALGRAAASLTNVAYGNYTAQQVNALAGTSFSTVRQGIADIPDVHLATGVDLTRFQDTRGGTVTPMQIVQALNQLGVSNSGSYADTLSRQAAISILSSNQVTDMQGNVLSTAQVPKHAKGGMASPGFALVGEEGPELVRFSQPGQVYTAGQTKELFSSSTSDSGWADELRQLREDLNSALYSIAKFTQQSAKQLSRWDNDGMPEVRPA